jgi:ABC-type sugar transport system substrate-binding protein
MDINMRAQGAEAKWTELFGDQTFYYGDTAAESLSAEGGFNIANSILAAHPEVKYWFIVGTVEDITLGAGRAVEALNKKDTVLMTASGAAILPGEWDAGYDGVWIANYAVSPFYYSGTGTFGLLAMIDGRATKATLWPDQFLPGDQAARFMLKADMMTLANYKDYLGDSVRSFGVEFEG